MSYVFLYGRCLTYNNSQYGMFAISLRMGLKTSLMGGVENIPNPIFLLDKQK